MAEPIKTKTCRLCKQTKPLPGFCKDRKAKDGHTNDCKACRLKIMKKYSQTVKGKAKIKQYQQSEKAKAYHKRYRQTKKCKATQKRYRESIEGKIYHREYYHTEKGKESINKSQRKYRQSKKGQITIAEYKKKSRKYKKASNAIQAAIHVGKLIKPTLCQCHYCPKQAKEYHHHKGYAPEHWLDVVPVCKKCHYSIHYPNSSLSGVNRSL